MPRRKKEKKLETPVEKIRNFYKRWNIDFTESERWQDFKNRALNAYETHVGRKLLIVENAEAEFAKIIGRHTKSVRNFWDANLMFDQALAQSPAYNYLHDEVDIKKFVLGIQSIFWMEKINWEIKQDFLEDITEAVEVTGVPIEIADQGDDVFFYPSGAKLLDEKLVNDNLDWLNNYPNSYQLFRDALLSVGIKGKERHVIDNLRLSLELLVKAILNNNKSLENQKSELSLFFKSKNSSSEISNLFMQMLDYFTKYQNDKAKHSDRAKADEVEFILYITGNLMRFLLTRD